MTSLALTFAVLLPIATMDPGPPVPPAPLKTGELMSVSLRSPLPYPGGGPEPRLVHSERLRSTGATYMQVHFSEFQLAPGDEVVVRDPAWREAHRYSGIGRADGNPFWAWSVPGDTVLIEIYAVSPTGGPGYAIDQYVHGFEPLVPESICNADDKRDAKCFETSHPAHYEQARRVARVEGPGFVCTGSLISCANHFLTNEHCRDSNISAYRMRFDYEDDCNGGGAVGVSFSVIADLSNDGPLDYWLVQLGGDPVAQFGFLDIDGRPLVANEEIYIPQHPGGRPKEMGIQSDANAGNLCRIDDPVFRTVDTGYLCDTEGGSSGSPVLSAANHQMIALHHTGGCLNGGIRMENILPRIAAFLPPTIVPPVNPMASVTGMNQIQFTWDLVPGAVSYRIRRAEGGCRGNFQDLATVPLPPYLDNGVSGLQTYGYIVQSVPASGCAGRPSTCVEALATGTCTVPPTFAGIRSVVQTFDPGCELELEWAAATGFCSSDVVYNVYRDTTPGFVPDSAINLLASCVSSTGFTDSTVMSGTRYYYVVRAEDRMSVGTGPCAGGVEQDVVGELSGSPVTDAVLVELLDGAEMMASSFQLDTPWAITTRDAQTGAASFNVPGATTALCAALTSPPFVVGSLSSTLTYAHREEGIEATWDGGTVEISEDAGLSWQRLDPNPGYPGLFDPRSSSCNHDGSAGGVYDGDRAWDTASVPLGSWLGREIQLRFRFATDESTPSTGWWLDDIRITDIAAGQCSQQQFLKLYRSTVASVAAGWKGLVPLPLEPLSNIDTGWPHDVLAPGSEADPNILSDTSPLILYRLLDATGAPLGNQLRVVKSSVSDATISW